MNKLYENEKLFERTNKKMAEAVSGIAPTDFPKDLVLELYCECANKVCHERVSIAYDEYSKAKKYPTFIIKPEHILPEFERLIRKSLNYWIIAKKAEKLNKQFEV